MKRRMICLALLSATFLGLAWYRSESATPQAPAAAAQADSKDKPGKADPKPDPNAGAREVVLANVQTYMDAFNRRDLKKLLGLFTEDCDVTENDGTQVLGLKELEGELKDAFASEPNAQISIALDSLTFLTPEVAIEVGKTTFYPDGKTLTAQSEYQVTHVKKGQRWLMGHVRVFNRQVLSPYDRLRELEWLVGHWVDEGAESLIETSYDWDDNKSFLLQRFKIRIKGQKVLEGNQRIGWDPLTKQIKAWAFDSEGGYAESLWSSIDDGWVIKGKGVRQDGRSVTATNQITQVSKDMMKFESLDRIVGEERMPAFTVFAVRKPPAPKE